MRHVVIAVALLVAAVVPRAHAERVLGSDRVQALVTVEDVARDVAAIRGRLVNRSPYEVTDVRVLGTDAFLWANERHPGDDDPGQTATATIPGPVPPGGAVPVAIPMPPRPQRTDGRFVPSAQVLEFTQTTPASAPSPTAAPAPTAAPPPVP